MRERIEALLHEIEANPKAHDAPGKLAAVQAMMIAIGYPVEQAKRDTAFLWAGVVR